MPASFGIVDLFAGPGGLGEGFASLREGGRKPFDIGISVEREASAHRTLTLRAFLRNYRDRHGLLPRQFVDFHAGRISEPDWETVGKTAWQHATAEARCLELGTQPATDAIDAVIPSLRRNFDDSILIGGPPCQAYSLVGRARARGKIGYVPEEDERHYLFREYISVLDRLRPAAFVMENVKGMLSSTVESRRVFEMLVEDLASLGTGGRHLYELKAIRLEDGRASLQDFSKPSDFIVCAEEFGVPQRRHRVIIVGIRADLESGISGRSIEVARSPRTVAEAIGNLPRLRSGLSRELDALPLWRAHAANAAATLADLFNANGDKHLAGSFGQLESGFDQVKALNRSSRSLPVSYGQSRDELLNWLECSELEAVAQHETRAHMVSDLGRYLFAAVFGAQRGFSPKAKDFPEELSPEHRNWKSGVFNDRFRVQIAGEPSTTVTSHISKDGHYFIHPDATQCRSLTVREAARLQTFPDDYYFLGNRTQQYVQVGNAVPPFLARQIARLLVRALGN
ncbi:DNA cytosine methyltransferase [Roseibium aestuarii]|uniref:Cytosine-specific methyltransferase n=1 Tax=Roseibium aestuarii TaxID=2600299 RepID=A0ABW4JS75_9HYPH|nr:DNA cytosine methyltransferase [Roseibium aestuarii]